MGAPWRPAPGALAAAPRSHSPAFEREWLLRWGLVFAGVAMFCAVGWLLVRQAGGIDLDALWEKIDAVQFPWEPGLPNGEPVVETTEFRWPWESKVVSAPKGGNTELNGRGTPRRAPRRIRCRSSAAWSWPRWC